MPVNTDAVLSVVQQLAEQEKLRVAVSESGKGALIAGSCAFLGGLFGGAGGLAIGGVLGSLGAALNGAGKYKSLVSVIAYDMTPSQKEKLVNALTAAVRDIQVEDAAVLLTIVMGNASLQKMLIFELGKFFKSEMGLAIA